MLSTETSHAVSTIAALEALYGTPASASVKKEVDHVHPHYRSFTRRCRSSAVPCPAMDKSSKP